MSVSKLTQAIKGHTMFINAFGEEFDLKDYMRSLGEGWEFVRMFNHPTDSFAMVVETRHPDHGTMQQGLILA